jgi:hypothetical protein
VLQEYLMDATTATFLLLIGLVVIAVGAVSAFAMLRAPRDQIGLYSSGIPLLSMGMALLALIVTAD